MSGFTLHHKHLCGLFNYLRHYFQQQISTFHIFFPIRDYLKCYLNFLKFTNTLNALMQLSSYFKHADDWPASQIQLFLWSESFHIISIPCCHFIHLLIKLFLAALNCLLSLCLIKSMLGNSIKRL